MIEPADIARLLASGRFTLTTEKACQADINDHLRRHLPEGCAVLREYRLGPFDIPDFMIGERVVIEVKIRGATQRDTVRQLARYAAYDEVRALILATSRAMQMPATIGGKPLLYVALGRAWL